MTSQERDDRRCSCMVQLVVHVRTISIVVNALRQSRHCFPIAKSATYILLLSHDREVISYNNPVHFKEKSFHGLGWRLSYWSLIVQQCAICKLCFQEQVNVCLHFVMSWFFHCTVVMVKFPFFLMSSLVLKAFQFVPREPAN